MTLNYVPQLTSTEYYYNLKRVCDLLNGILNQNLLTDVNETYAQLRRAQELLADLVKVTNPKLYDELAKRFERSSTFHQAASYHLVPALILNGPGDVCCCL